MKKILVAKDVNYAASKTSATQETATRPDLLADGAIGVYALNIAADGKLALVTASNDDVVNNNPFVIAQGTFDGCIISDPIVAKHVRQYRGQEYVAPVKQVTYVGYNGTSGDLAVQASIANGDEAMVTVVNTTDGRQQFPKRRYTGIMAGSDADYDVALSIVNNIIGVLNNNDHIVIGEIVGTGTVTEFGDAADPTFTNGSAVVTFAGNVTLAAGTFVVNSGAIYKIAVGVAAGTTITLDRPYQGETVTVDQSATVDVAGAIASITALGIKLTAKNNGEHFKVAVSGVLAGSPISYVTSYNPGSGTYADILALEEEFESYSKGRTAKNYGFSIPAVRFAVTAETYDKIIFEYLNTGDRKDVRDVQMGSPKTLLVAFPDDNAGANKGETTTETVLNTIMAEVNFAAIDITD